jgi:hypothetical protein
MNENLIIIPYDYSHPDALSYMEVNDEIKKETALIFTNCLNFFDFSVYDKGYDVKVLKRDGSYILLSELLNNPHVYTPKIIRKAHNVSKMLMANSFEFKKEQWMYSGITVKTGVPKREKPAVTGKDAERFLERSLKNQEHLEEKLRSKQAEEKKQNRWVVKFSDLKTVDTLKEMGILHYLPKFHEQLKFAFIDTEMSQEEVLKIDGIESIREERVGTLYV